MVEGGSQGIEDKLKTSLCDYRFSMWVFITVSKSDNWEQVVSAKLNQNFQPAFIPFQPQAPTWGV